MDFHSIKYWLKLSAMALVILICGFCTVSMILYTLEESGLGPKEGRTESEIKGSLDSDYYDGAYGDMLETLGRYCGEQEEAYEKYWNMARFYEGWSLMKYWEQAAQAHPEMGYEEYEEKYRLKMEEEYNHCQWEDNLGIMDSLLKQ